MLKESTMLSFAMLAAIAAPIIVMHVAYNKYEARLITAFGLGVAASVFIGGGLLTGFVPSAEGFPSIAFGAVLGLVLAVAHSGPEHSGETFVERKSSSFPMTAHASGRIMDISMPSVVFTDKAFTMRKAA